MSEASDVIVAEVPFVSVLIAARNEASEIGTCIECFKHQRYPKDRFEVIIINDQSTDATSDIIKEQIKSASINLRQLFTSGAGGKKEAIYEGLLNAKGSIILTTDADCRVPETWIADFTEKFKATGAYFITGPVML
ncbi:MAG TPA: glycosyltransferase, partial [Bacteroidales bacterium]|nr:glycosyltransferase [Bacteroidales bacterium]